MASSQVDQKFLGKLAKGVEHENPLLASMLFKILGLSLNLARQLVAAKKHRPRPDANDEPAAPLVLRRVVHILWLAREGLVMLQQYVLPFVGRCTELKVLAYKLRASFNHVFVLFHNRPPVSTMSGWTPELLAAAAQLVSRADGLRVRSDQELPPAASGASVGPPPGFEAHAALLPPSFLLPLKDYLPTADECFQEAISLADQLLWGSHSLRLSVRTEYAAFLYDCVHDVDASRKLAKQTIADVYAATEGMDDDMFRDSCELVTVLGKMMKRGLVSALPAPHPPKQPPASQSPAPHPKPVSPPLDIENAI
ncbi:hypothetical protein CDD81_3748 [Ophiocordyceps australis]|uniref:14-3-3 domain-containing protein n=1 Tax=Ophiocordyceps australis TaxID=1399860 RepID=A0A2C5YDF0_9HYPO|nr:hypothetical protein CDD81_3748 [Ophiocordyceps australis]